MDSLQLAPFFEDINTHFQHSSIEEQEDLCRFLQIEKEENQRTFICLNEKIIDPKDSTMVSALRRFKNYLNKNKELISGIDFDVSEKKEYLVKVNYTTERRLKLDEEGVPTATGEEYTCLRFTKLRVKTITVSSFHTQPFVLHYSEQHHVFLQDERHGLILLETRGRKKVALPYEHSLTYMDDSFAPIYQKINPFILEMLHEKDVLPFSWLEILQAKNKYELLCKKYPTKRFSKKVNKYPLRYTYALQKLKPKVTEQQLRKIEASIEQTHEDIFPSELFRYERKNSREFVQSLLLYYVRHWILQDLSEHTYHTVKDLIAMSVELKKKLAFPFTTIKGARKQHQQVMKEYTLHQWKKLKEYKLKQHEKYKRLIKQLKKEPSFTLIKTNKELFFEGEDMQHCVYSYLGKIQKGRSIIWKYERDTHRYTVEIEKRRNGKYQVIQCYGKYDTEPDEQELEKIKRIVEAVPYR